MMPWAKGAARLRPYKGGRRPVQKIAVNGEQSPPRSILASAGRAFLASKMSAALLARIFFWVWFGAAVFVGQSLVLQRLPGPVVPAIVFGLTAILLPGYTRINGVRSWVDALDLRTLVL